MELSDELYQQWLNVWKKHDPGKQQPPTKEQLAMMMDLFEFTIEDLGIHG